jgi:predicted regulator of Ras-like GTPase activity (Roadblock/LC7/MglB family)
MTAAEALADLDDLSTQVRTAVLFRPDGAVLASTLGDEERARRLAEAAQAALDAAGRIRGHGGARVTGLEAAVPGGSLFVAAGDDHVVAATTAPDEPAGLVLYDLRTCLRRLEDDA